MAEVQDPPSSPRAAHGAIWSAADFWVQQLAQLLTFVLVGNILGPEVVGLMTMALVTTLFFATFLENGFADTLIQSPELRQEHFNAAFWLVLGLASLEALILWAATPLVAGFFSEPRLKAILPLMALALPFIGVTACYGAMLQRQLKFRALATRSIFAYGLGFVVAYGLAKTGHGVYSLVGFFLTARGLDAVLIVIVSKVRPGLQVSKAAFLDVIDFGKHRVAHQTLIFITGQFDRFVIGRFLGAEALGLYAIAERLVTALVNGVSGVFQRVAFPVLSARQNDRADFDRTLRDFITAASVVSFPIFMGLAITCHRLIGVMFTQHWDGVPPLMIVLCVLGLVHPANYLLTAATNALGRPDIVVKLGIPVLAVRVVLSIAAAQISLLWVASANSFVYAASLPVFMAVVNKLFRGRWIYFFADSWRPGLAALLMAVATLSVESFAGGLNDLTALVLEVGTGGLTYIVALRLIAPEIFGRALTLVTKRA